MNGGSFQRECLALTASRRHSENTADRLKRQNGQNNGKGPLRHPPIISPTHSRSKLGVITKTKEKRSVILPEVLAASVKVVIRSVPLLLTEVSSAFSFSVSGDEFLNFRRLLDRECVGDIIGR